MKQCFQMIFSLTSNEMQPVRVSVSLKESNDADPVAPTGHRQPLPNGPLANDLRGPPLGIRFPRVGFVEIERQTKTRIPRADQFRDFAQPN